VVERVVCALLVRVRRVSFVVLGRKELMGGVYLLTVDFDEIGLKFVLDVNSNQVRTP